MESSDSDVWTRGEPVTLRRSCSFLRKGTTLELDSGNILIPLEEAGKRSIKTTDAGRVYVWSFLLPDGSVTEFYLHTVTYKHAKNVDRAMKEDMRKFFSRPNKRARKVVA